MSGLTVPKIISPKYLTTILSGGAILLLFSVVGGCGVLRQDEKTEETSLVQPQAEASVEQVDGVETVEVQAPLASRFNAAGNYDPLNEETDHIVWGTAEDEHPEWLDASREELEGRHYFFSDEQNHALFYGQLQNLGGAYMGVGTDQLYLFTAWMRAELAFATDYDPWIRELHHLYLYAFARYDNIRDFVSFWNRKNYPDNRVLIAEHFANHDERDLLLKVFDRATYSVHHRMNRIRSMAREYSVSTFVTDDAEYAFIRNLVLARRIRPTLSNLLDTTSLAALSEMLRKVGVPLRVFYISNAEEYWPYSERFRTNMAALPFDERGVLLRTSASKVNSDYRYNLQTAASFQAWVVHPDIHRHTQYYDRPFVRHETHFPFSVTDHMPPENEK